MSATGEPPPSTPLVRCGEGDPASDPGLGGGSPVMRHWEQPMSATANAELPILPIEMEKHPGVIALRNEIAALRSDHIANRGQPMSDERIQAITRALRNMGWNIRAGSGERQLQKVLDGLGYAIVKINPPKIRPPMVIEDDVASQP